MRFRVAIGVQVAAWVASALLAWLSPIFAFLPTVLMFVYVPFILGVGLIGNFKGEQAMIYPIVFGIPLGIILYAFIFARVFGYFKDRKRRMPRP